MSNITILGLGAMGSRMAEKLLTAGHSLTVWNRTANKATALLELGATTAATPAAAVQEADVVISMVRDNKASESVWLGEHGALAAMPKHAIAIESSTLSPSWIKQLHTSAQQLGIELIEAPVAGSRSQVENAVLIYFLAGNHDAKTQVTPILKTMASNIHDCGSIGQAAAIKLAVNTLFGVQVALMAELVTMLIKQSNSTEQALEIIASTPVCSPAAALSAKAILNKQYAPMFPIELVEKDFFYALELAEAMGMKLPVSEATHELYQHAIHQGFGDSNINGVAQLFE